MELFKLYSSSFCVLKVGLASSAYIKITNNPKSKPVLNFNSFSLYRIYMNFFCKSDFLRASIVSNSSLLIHLVNVYVNDWWYFMISLTYYFNIDFSKHNLKFSMIFLLFKDI